jgi:hypothetical protein
VEIFGPPLAQKFSSFYDNFFTKIEKITETLMMWTSLRMGHVGLKQK